MGWSVHVPHMHALRITTLCDKLNHIANYPFLLTSLPTSTFIMTSAPESIRTHYHHGHGRKLALARALARGTSWRIRQGQSNCSSTPQWTGLRVPSSLPSSVRTAVAAGSPAVAPQTSSYLITPGLDELSVHGGEWQHVYIPLYVTTSKVASVWPERVYTLSGHTDATFNVVPSAAYTGSRQVHGRDDDPIRPIRSTSHQPRVAPRLQTRFWRDTTST